MKFTRVIPQRLCPCLGHQHEVTTPSPLSDSLPPVVSSVSHQLQDASQERSAPRTSRIHAGGFNGLHQHKHHANNRQSILVHTGRWRGRYLQTTIRTSSRKADQRCQKERPCSACCHLRRVSCRNKAQHRKSTASEANREKVC